MENGLKITQVRVWTCFRKCSCMACLYQTALFKRNEETPRKINEGEEKQRTISSHNFLKKKMEVKIRAMGISFKKDYITHTYIHKNSVDYKPKQEQINQLNIKMAGGGR